MSTLGLGQASHARGPRTRLTRVCCAVCGRHCLRCVWSGPAPGGLGKSPASWVAPGHGPAGSPEGWAPGAGSRHGPQAEMGTRGQAGSDARGDDSWAEPGSPEPRKALRVPLACQEGPIPELCSVSRPGSGQASPPGPQSRAPQSSPILKILWLFRPQLSPALPSTYPVPSLALFIPPGLALLCSQVPTVPRDLSCFLDLPQVCCTPQPPKPGSGPGKRHGEVAGRSWRGQALSFSHSHTAESKNLPFTAPMLEDLERSRGERAPGRCSEGQDSGSCAVT